MTRDDLESAMSFAAEHACAAHAAGDLGAAGTLRSKWWALRDRLDALDKATADPFDDASVGLPVRLAYEAPAIEATTDGVDALPGVA